MLVPAEARGCEGQSARAHFRNLLIDAVIDETIL